ncbi:MAG TPA: exopolysaccharide biosynthesis protein [Chthoniobacterales bacterium]
MLNTDTAAKATETGEEHEPKPQPRRLSEELLDVSLRFKTSEVHLRDLMGGLDGRVYTLVLVLLSLPFCQPIALPGLSTPFGVVIALFGLRFAFRQKPWLPKRLLNVRIPSKVFPAVLRAGAKMIGYLEKLLHPRLTWVFEYRITQFLSGMAICACGIFLLLPLPIPFSNLIPAFAIILIAASNSERDGIMLSVGGGVFALTLVFFGGLFFGGKEFVGWIRDSFKGMFDPGEQGMKLGE